MSTKKTEFITIPKGTHWRTISKMPYLNGTQIKNDGIVTILGFKEEEFFDKKQGEKTKTLVMYVSGHEQGIILGSRKYKQIEKALDSTDASTWEGKKILLVAPMEKWFGEMMPVIGFRKAVIILPEMNSKHKLWDKFISSIVAGKSTVEQAEAHYKITPKVKKEISALVESKKNQRYASKGTRSC